MTLDTVVGKRFRDLSEIAATPNSRVYAAFDTLYACQIAIKSLSTHSNDFDHLKSEFRSLSGVKHQNLVELFEFQAHPRESFFTMELLEGTDPINRFRGDGDQTRRLMEIRYVFAQLATGLAALHEVGLIHRDVKPANLMVTVDDRGIVLDYGFVTQAVEPTTDFYGTLNYAAPEQVTDNSLAPASDWYALGVVMLESIKSEYPFSTLTNRLRGEQPELGELKRTDYALCGLLEAMLEIDPSNRPTGDEVVYALSNHAADLSSVSVRNVAANLIGREPELAKLNELYGKGVYQSHLTVGITGQPGVGKTSLVDEFLRNSVTPERLFIRTSCHVNERVSYNATRDVIARLVEWTAAREPKQDTSAVRNLLSSQTSAGETALMRTLKAAAIVQLEEITRTISESVAVILWIDDIHWATLDNMPILRALATGLERGRGMTLLTYRDEERAQLARQQFLPDNFVEFELTPLNEMSSRVLTEQLWREADTETVARVIRSSGGLPYLITESVMLERESLRSSGDVFLERIQNLPPSHQQALNSVALGGPIRDDVLLRSLPSKSRIAIPALFKLRLIRYEFFGNTRHLDVYHERVRQCVTSMLPESRTTETYRKLASSLRSSPEAYNLAQLYQFYRLGAQPVHACRIAYLLGLEAKRQLAFEYAETLFGECLAISPSPFRRRQAGVQRAECLGLAGRGRASGDAYLRLSADFDTSNLRRRWDLEAANQFLSAGYIAEGKAVFRSVFRQWQFNFPTEQAEATRESVELWNRFQYTSAPDLGAATNQPESEQVEAFFSASRGFEALDFALGGLFNIRTFHLAVSEGSARQLCRSMIMLGGGPLAGGDSKIRTIGRAFLDEANRYLEFHHDIELIGLMMANETQRAMLAGKWITSIELMISAIKYLEDNRTGSDWERNLTYLSGVRSMIEVGDWGEALTVSRKLYRHSIATGNVYSGRVNNRNIAHIQAMRGETESSREHLRNFEHEHTATSFTRDDFYDLRTELFSYLHEGRVTEAGRILERIVSEVHDSNLLNTSMPLIDYVIVRARVKLARRAASVQEGDFQLSQIAQLRKIARTFERVDCSAHVALLEANVSQLSGSNDCIVQLKEAERLFRLSGMRPMMSVARLCLALVSDEPSVDLTPLGLFGVNHPNGFLRIHAPAFANWPHEA